MDRLSTEIWATLAESLRPKGVADYAIISVLTFCSTAYLSHGMLWDRPNPYHYRWFERPQCTDSSSTRAQNRTRNIAVEMKNSNTDIVVFWGSQSGTAEGFAHRLARECHLRFNISIMVADISEYEAKTISLIPNDKFAVFLLSTFGEGDPSDNAVSFWGWLQNPDSSLINLRYMAFGLGNRNYQHYNRVIDVVTQNLDSLGAKCVMPIGKADDANGATEEDFLAWKDNLFQYLTAELSLTENSAFYTPCIHITKSSADLSGQAIQAKSIYRAMSNATQSFSIEALDICNWKELLTSNSRNCIHIEFDISKYPEMRYKTGDHLAIWPSNPDNEVQILLEVFGLFKDRKTPLFVGCNDSSIKIRIPSPIDPDRMFRHCIDICGRVSRDTILGLLPFAPSDPVRCFLDILGKSKEAYSQFTSRNYVTIGRLLKLALAVDQSTRWSEEALCYLLEALPALKPRYYSICSSAIILPRRPSISVLVSKSFLPYATETYIPGLASTQLQKFAEASGMAAGTHFPINNNMETSKLDTPTEGLKLYGHIRRSKFKLPSQASTPIIMIGAGTGLAPFRAFIAERARMSTMGRQVGKMHLYFGCRHPEEDFIYQEDLDSTIQLLGEVFEVFVAFSRVPGTKKRYVQDSIQERRRSFLDLAKASANIYICGRTSMANAVRKTVVNAFTEIDGLKESDAQEWVEVSKRRAKWQEDVWS